MARCFMIAALLAATVSAGAQSLFWMQSDPDTSRLGSTTNPTVTVQVDRTVPLYLWFTDAGTTYGFDGISLDARLIRTSGSGQAAVSMNIDRPAGRWDGATGGVLRTDTGGEGVDDANAFDLTNTDTIAQSPARFAVLSITGVNPGTVYLFLCVGGMRISDGGGDTLLRFGFANGSTSPESFLISGGSYGLSSNVPEATIVIEPAPADIPGDFDGDEDVDLEDFGQFQACLSGDFNPQPDTACEPALLDGDTDVDQSDLTIFLRCLSGANVTADPSCAD